MSNEKTKLIMEITQEEKEKIRELSKIHSRGNMTAFIIRAIDYFEKNHNEQ